MSHVFNVYCDESCHLENDHQTAMVLGAVWCPLEKTRDISKNILENPDKPEVLAWDNKEGDGSIKTYLWLKSFNFLVLMKKYRDGRRRLITSYYVNYPHKRRNLEKKYKRRIS